MQNGKIQFSVFGHAKQQHFVYLKFKFSLLSSRLFWQKFVAFYSCVLEIISTNSIIMLSIKYYTGWHSLARKLQKNLRIINGYIVLLLSSTLLSCVTYINLWKFDEDKTFQALKNIKKKFLSDSLSY